MITRRADTDSGDYLGGQFIERFATADAGSYSRINVEGAFDRLGVFGGGSYFNVNDLDRGGRLGRQEMTNYSQYAGDLKFDYLLDDGHILTLSLQHLEQTDVPRTDKWPKESRLFSPQQRNLAYLRWQGTELNSAVDAVMITFSYGRQKEGTLKRKPPASLIEDRSQFDVNTAAMNLVFTSDLDWIGKLTYGLDWYHDDIDADAARFDLTGVNPPQPRVPQYPDDAYYERIGTFLQWSTDVTDRLAAVSGVRYSNIDLGATVALFDPADPTSPPVDTSIRPSFQDWTASIGLTYRLSPHVNLVGSVAEGFRSPSLDELTSFSDNVNEGIDIPNPNLTPETSINYEVGLKFDYRRVRAQTFVFWTDLDQLLVRRKVNEIPDPTSPGDVIDVLMRQNTGNAKLQGYELGAELLLTPRWSSYGNLAYVLGEDLGNAEPLSRIPPVQGVLGLRWRDEESRNWIDLYGWLVARQTRLSARDVRDSRIPPGGTPGYVTLNLRLGSYIGRNQRITLGIENLTDRAYRVHGSGVDGPGISGQFGYELFY